MTRPARPRPENASGFSLIETLIAAFLFAIMLLGTLPMFLRAVQDNARNRNYLHFNQGVQALNDELIQRCASKFAYNQATGDCVSSTDASLSLGWHVFNNYTNQTNATGVPITVQNLFKGTQATQSGDKSVQNNLLGQVQYLLSSEFGRVRVDIQMFYFSSNSMVRSMSGLCSGTSNSCNPDAPPPGMAVIRLTNYIDLPM